MLDEAPASPEASSVPDSVKVPKGMVYVPGGTTYIGIKPTTFRRLIEERPPGARHMWGKGASPGFEAEVEPFFLGEHEVTVAQFRKFVEATGYTTDAEAFGNAGVLDPQAVAPRPRSYLAAPLRALRAEGEAGAPGDAGLLPRREGVLPMGRGAPADRSRMGARGAVGCELAYLLPLGHERPRR